MPLKCTFKWVKVICFILCDFYHNTEPDSKYFRFTGHVISVASTQLCHNRKAAVHNTQTNECFSVPIKLLFLDSSVHSSVQLLSHVRFFVTSWSAVCQASFSITNSWSLLKLMSTVLVMPSNHLILCRSLLLLPSIFPSIRVFSSESVLCIRWPKYWSFIFSISPL